MSTSNASSENPGRVNYLDTLRALTIGAALVGYGLLPFSGANWLVKSDTILPIAPLLAVIGNQFFAPLLFFIAGAAAYFSLGKRSPQQYMRERLRRLVVPLAVLFVVLSPVQVWFDAHFNGRTGATVPNSLRAVINPIRFGNADPGSVAIFSSHLWCLLILFVFAVLTLPAFLWLRSERRNHLVDRLSGPSRWRGGLLIFALPMVVANLLLRLILADFQLLADIIFWLGFYILGFVFFTRQTYMNAIKRGGGVLLFVMIASTFAVLLTGLLTAFDVRQIFDLGYLNTLLSSPLAYVVTGTLLTIASLAAVFLALSLAARYADFTSPLQSYVREASLPMYLLFPPVLVVVSSYILQIRIDAGFKVLITGLTTFGITFGFYALFVRSTKFLRVALGMRGLATSSSPATVPRPGPRLQRIAYLIGVGIFAALISAGIGIDLDGASSASQWQVILPGGDTTCGQGTPYRFFVRDGTNSERLMIYFQTGGACWNAATCSQGSFVTDHTVDDPEDELGWYHGIFDLENPANPVSEYNIVFAAYCTSDVHTGAADVEYTDIAGNSITINHQGAANSKAVLEWVYEHFQSPARILVIGTSAGTMGSIYYASYIMDHYRDSQIIQLGDGLVGIMPDDWEAPFVWKSDANLSPVVRDRVLSGAPGEIVNNLYLGTAEHFAQHRFGLFTTAADIFQIGYFNFAGGNIPDWADLMNSRLEALQDQLPNFSSYVAPGFEHTILALPSFYTTEVNGVYFRDWFADYVEGRPVPNVRCERGRSYCP